MNQGEPEVLASGRTAEVLAWQDGWVLKLFFGWFSEQSVRYEARLARALHAAGLPVPAVGEIISWNGRPGLPYERLDGPSMEAQLLSEADTLRKHARTLAELQQQIQGIRSVPGIPSQRAQLRRKIRAAPGLSQRQVQWLLEVLGELPDDDRLCHGDLHPANVLMTVDGPVVIDWIDATLGNPLADVARSAVILGGAQARVAQDDETLAGFIGRFLEAYLGGYFEIKRGGVEEFEAWRPVVAAARLSEGIEDQQEWLLAQVREGID